MNVNIPWWAKIGAKLVLSRLPFGYSVWQRLGLFRHGAMDSSRYAINTFNAHMGKSGLDDCLKGKALLELGPGDSIATAIIAAAYEARSVLVDVGAFVRSDLKPYRNLERVLLSEDLAVPSLSDCRSVHDILSKCRSKYLVDGLRSLKEIEDESIDVIFSQAVLEHIRVFEFKEIIRECRRVLRPGGICSHKVDLKDHLGGALNNLRFSDEIWESRFLASSGFYTNRIRYQEMLTIFEQENFQIVSTEPARWAVLPTRRVKMASRFRSLPESDLLVSGFSCLIQKA